MSQEFRFLSDKRPLMIDLANRCRLFGLAGIVLAGPLLSAASPPPIVWEKRVTVNGVGPITFKVEVRFAGKSTQRMTIGVSAMNDSKFTIRKIHFCIQLEGRTCSSSYNWTKSMWEPGTARSWPSLSVEGHAVGILATKAADLRPSNIQIDIQDIERDQFASVRKIFVEKLEGDFGDVSALAREQVMAAVVNSRRFQLVDDRSQADAILKGRAERRSRGTSTESSGQEENTRRATLGGLGNGAAPFLYPIIGMRAKTNGASSAESSSRTLSVFDEYLILRLVTNAGESIWAWDDTKTCEEYRVKCAIEDLYRATLPVPTLPRDYEK